MIPEQTKMEYIVFTIPAIIPAIKTFLRFILSPIYKRPEVVEKIRMNKEIAM